MFISRRPTRRRLLAMIGSGPLLVPMLRTGAAEAASAPIVQPQAATPAAFMARAFVMYRQALESGDQPYGAIVVRDGRIIGEAASHVVVHNDPTAHAEMEAIRDAAHNLLGAVLYSTSHPCRMCEAAAHWAGIGRMVHGRSLSDAGTPSLCD
jgi:tRNA(Arg) A34 adenosine deaminase TadA